MEGARPAALRPAPSGALACRRGASLEARLAHPVFEPYRHWLEQLGPLPGVTLERLNGLAAQADVRTEAGRRIRFVPPDAGSISYERRIHEVGEIETRPQSLHDLFNALAWLAFPKTKARLNALHVRHLSRESGRRGRFRDLLTIFDEGGALVQCSDRELEHMVEDFQWKELFWTNRVRLQHSMRVFVLGHAVLEKACSPWPGITCKAVFLDPALPVDDQAADWLGSLPDDATPKGLPPFPVFGLPGWHERSHEAEFYEDERYFRKIKSRPGAGRTAAVPGTEESPGSTEQDAG